MLIHIVPHHSLATYGAQGGAPPAPNFDAAGYNNAFYAWKSGSYDGGYWNGGRNREYCNEYLRNGWGDSNDDPSCRSHDVTYNEWHDLDDSASEWANPVTTDATSVDSWLSNVGGGIYKARPTQLLRLFAR